MILMPENTMSKEKHAISMGQHIVPLEERHLYKTSESLQKRGFLENIYLDGPPQQTDVKERTVELAIDKSGSGIGSVAGCCEQGNVRTLYQLTNY
jgi:hypothetical protein